MPARFPRALRAGRQTVCLEVHPPRSRSSPRSPRRTPTVPVLIRCYMTDTEPQRNSEWDHLATVNSLLAPVSRVQRRANSGRWDGQAYSSACETIGQRLGEFLIVHPSGFVLKALNQPELF